MQNIALREYKKGGELNFTAEKGVPKMGSA